MSSSSVAESCSLDKIRLAFVKPCFMLMLTSCSAVKVKILLLFCTDGVLLANSLCL